MKLELKLISEMSPKITLKYFPARGMAEVIRFTLAAAEVPYENVRVSLEEWESLKNSPGKSINMNNLEFRFYPLDSRNPIWRSARLGI